MSDRFDQYYMMQTQAKKSEQLGNENKAIDLYLEIVKTYSPYDDYCFDRLSVLLEKNGRISEAIHICDSAFEKIQNSVIKGDKHKYEERLKRLHDKEKTLTSHTKHPQRDKEDIDLHMPFFRHITGRGTLYSLALYGLVLAISFPNHWLRFIAMLLFLGFIDYLVISLINLSKGRKTLINMTLSLLFLAATVFTSLQLPEVKSYIQLTEDQKNAESQTMVKESAGDIKEDTDQPLIDEPLLEKARRTIELEPVFDSCLLQLNGNKVEITLIVIAGTEKPEAERIFKKLARNIGALATENGATPPSGEFYGGVYNTYSLAFQAIDTFDTLILKGSLINSTLSIQD